MDFFGVPPDPSGADATGLVRCGAGVTLDRGLDFVARVLGLADGFTLRWVFAPAGWVSPARTSPAWAVSKQAKTAVAPQSRIPAAGTAPSREPRTPEKAPRRGPEEADRAEDRDLVHRIKAGEKDLFSRFVVKYHGRIYTVVSRILASPEDAEEATQDAFVAAYRKISSFREEAQFYSWLFRIATNQALNRLRANRVRGEGRKESLDAIMEDGWEGRLEENDPPPDDSPARACEESEWLALIERALARLTPTYRTVVVMRDVEGLTYEEISLQTGLALGTVKSRLHAGRAILRRILEQHGIGR